MTVKQRVDELRMFVTAGVLLFALAILALSYGDGYLSTGALVVFVVAVVVAFVGAAIPVLGDGLRSNPFEVFDADDERRLI